MTKKLMMNNQIIDDCKKWFQIYELSEAFNTINDSRIDEEGRIYIDEIWGNTDSDSKNLFDGELRQGSISSSDGNIQSSNTIISSVNFIHVNGAKILYVYREKTKGSFAFRCYDANEKYLGPVGVDNGHNTFSFDLKDGTVYVKFIDLTNDLTNKYTIATEYVNEYIPYHKIEQSNIPYVGELYVDENNEPKVDEQGRKQYKIEISADNGILSQKMNTDIVNGQINECLKVKGAVDITTRKEYTTFILIPCQLMKVGDLMDRLYWDVDRGKYMVEKGVVKVADDIETDVTMTDNISPELIETDITERIELPCYNPTTFISVNSGIVSPSGIRALIPMKAMGEPVLDGLICWLDAKDGSGQYDIWSDRSGHGHFAILKGFNFNNSNGWTGTSLKFNGNNYCEIKNLHMIEGNNRTFEFKLNFNGPDTIRGILSDRTAYNNGFSISIYNKTLCCDVSYKDIHQRNNTTIVMKNQINYTISINEHGELKVYENGTCVYVDKFDTHGSNFPYDKSTWKIGRFGDSTCPFIGEINYIRVYNRLLTEEEINHNYEYEQSIQRENTLNPVD